MQQKPQPADEEAEVVSGGGEDGIDGITLAIAEIVAAHPMLGFEMADDGLDGGASSHLALDLWGDAPLLACDEDPELVIGRRVVAAITLVGEETQNRIADERFHVGDHFRQGVAIVGIARQRFDMGYELAALGMAMRRCDRDLDADLWTTPALQEESTNG